MKWIREHKATLGLLLTFVSGGLAAIGQTEAAAAVGVLQVYLLGAGIHPSDKEARRQ